MGYDAGDGEPSAGSPDPLNPSFTGFSSISGWITSWLERAAAAPTTVRNVGGELGGWVSSWVALFQETWSDVIGWFKNIGDTVKGWFT
jgi:hypothetical protein